MRLTVSRVKIGLNKTSKQKVKRYVKQIQANPIIDDKQQFIDDLESTLASEIYAQKNCSERAVTDFFFEELDKQLDAVSNISDTFFQTVIDATRKKLVKHYTSGKSYDNNVDIYFNEVKREYILHPQNESANLEFKPENYDIFIKNNLKLVISCAKQYQNKGLPFEDLIQLGNEGLLMAIEHFDANRGNLKIAIKKLIHESELASFTKDEAEQIVRKGFKYDDNLKATLKHLPEDGFDDKQTFEDWVNKHVQTAVFASVAFMWIRANIVNELERIGTVIRAPKKTKANDEFADWVDILSPSELEEIRDASSSLSSVTIINLDSINPYTDDCYHDNDLAEITQEQFVVEDEALEIQQRSEAFKDLVNSALANLSDLDRRVVKKRFGIGMPYELSINEIASSEGISSNKVKYILTTALSTIASSFNSTDKETILQLL